MDQSTVENMSDENTLRQMLEESDDLELRRIIRARLRQIKKETGKAEEPTSTPNSVKLQINEIPVGKDKVRPYKPIDTTDGKCSGNNELMQKSSALKKPVIPGGKESEPEKMKLETVVLRSSRSKDSAADKTTKKKMSKTTFESPSLRKVSPNQKSCDKSKPSSIISTPKDAFARFKEIDSHSARSDHLSAEAPGERSGRRSPSPNSIKEQTLNWCKARCDNYDNVEIVDFSSSWNDGLGFCALIHSFYPEAFDYDQLEAKNRKENFQLAFDTAEKFAQLAPLLDADDMSQTLNPDWRCVFTYVNSLATRISEIRKEQRNSQEENEDKTT